jgi:hypothetical protein
MKITDFQAAVQLQIYRITIYMYEEAHVTKLHIDRE